MPIPPAAAPHLMLVKPNRPRARPTAQPQPAPQPEPAQAEVHPFIAAMADNPDLVQRMLADHARAFHICEGGHPPRGGRCRFWVWAELARLEVLRRWNIPRHAFVS